MTSFDTWLNQVPEKKPTEVELNSRRDMLMAMYDDVNRMLSDCDTIHADVPPLEDISSISAHKDMKHPLYNNNMYEEEWELYKGVAIDED